MELTLDEQNLLALFRALDEAGKREMLRHASLQHREEAASEAASAQPSGGQCRIERGEERPEIQAEPIFTE